MKRSLRLIGLCGATIAILSGGASAQQPPPPPTAAPAPAPAPAAAPAPSAAPVFDPHQLPAYSGQVDLFTLSPRGDIDGLVLADGTEVTMAPHLSTELAFSVKPGDRVAVYGLHAAALPLIEASAITDEADGRTVVDNGPPAPPPGPPPPRLGPPPRPAPPPPPEQAAGPQPPLPGLSEVSGRVRMLLHGPRAEVNGALLADNTILRLPPPEADRLAALLQPGQTVVAEGVLLSNNLGKVLDARQLGSSREQLSSLPAPPGPGPR